MDFRLTEEQLEFQQYCRKFSAEVIRPVAAKYDRKQSVPWDVIKEARKGTSTASSTSRRSAATPTGSSA